MTKTSIIIFDGICNLCEASVQFIIKRDKQGKFRFAAAQTTAGQKLQEQYGIDALEDQTLVLIENGSVYTRSRAAVRTARQLDGLWKLLSVFWIVPKPIRDRIYSFIAQNRYYWFGKKDQCLIPSDENKNRFL